MKRIFSLLFFFVVYASFSQNNPLWRSFFSYNNIVDISQSGDRVYAASENAVFSKSLLTGELKTITSVNGLKAETISAIYHSSIYKKTLVGNDNGLLLVINADDTILNVVDIIEETTIQPNRKKINHIYEYEGKVYLSCDFGIAVFNLETLQFGDTYYMGAGGTRIPVAQTAIHNGFIYAASLDNGMIRANINSPNLNDYNQWTVFSASYWDSVAVLNNELAAGSNNTLYKLNGNSFSVITAMESPILDLRVSGNYLIATGNFYVKIYNQQLQQQTQVTYIPEVSFSCATIVNDRIFIGTREKGVFSTALNNPSIFENITPDGPLRSEIFSLEKTSNAMWAVHGGYNYFYTPNESQYGISKLTDKGWNTIPHSKLFDAKSLSDIVVNPANENQVFIASHHSGLLKIEKDEPVILYNDSNTGDDGLETLVDFSSPNYRSIAINSLAFDKSGTLWMTNRHVEKPLKVLRPDGKWQSYSFKNITNNPLQDNYGKMVIDKNGTKWIPSYINGVIAFNENQNNKFILIKESEGNLPNNYVKSLAIDNRNQLWIGTIMGLRVLPSVDRFLTENELTTNVIIIMDEGVAQELLYGQLISDIVVDGSNNKWLGTSSAGAFLVSPNGQQTLFHFTKENSPLPSNNILDIEIDHATGEVFFATDKGMVSYLGTSTKAEDNLNNVYVFPNPVRPGFEGDINISGLIDRANIKITDIEGNLVYETTSEGGTVLWDTRAFGKHKVASGVYMIFITADDGSQTKVKKVMIVRGN